MAKKRFGGKQASTGNKVRIALAWLAWKAKRRRTEILAVHTFSDAETKVARETWSFQR